jgi:subtilisin family serine protease
MGRAIFFHAPEQSTTVCNMGLVRRIALLLFAATGAGAAFAQLPNVQVPNVPLPNLPRVGLPADVGNTVNGVAGRALEDVRRLRVRELLRTNRAALERDPRGEAMVRSELVAFSPSDEALTNAQAAGFEIARRQSLEGLDETLIILRAPRGMSTRRALQRLRALDPGGTYDFNHVYVESGEAIPIAAGGLLAAAPVVAGAEGAAAVAGVRPRIGLIDGGVDTAHPVFQDVPVRQHGCADKPVPSVHGTAVASLIAGRSGNFHGALPSAELFAADVYCGVDTGGAVDTVADAMAWMARERVPVVNVSLVGPQNATLAAVVRVLIARGHVIVAAVGNDGPSARPLYPASYPGVVGVTGVDARKRVLIEACRGPQVDFAAPGADMAAALSAQTFATVRGTSFAAPIVAGLIASSLTQPDRSGAEQAIARLAQQAVDLGSRGMDKTYGNGLVGDSVRIEPTLAGLGK